MTTVLVVVFCVCASALAYCVGYSNGQYDGARDAAETIGQAMLEILDKVREIVEKDGGGP